MKGGVLIFYLDITKLRHKKHLKQSELAKLSHLSQNYLSELEQNKSKKVQGVTLRTVAKIANALDVPGDEILKWNKENKKDKEQE